MLITRLGYKLVLKNIRHIPDIRLISLSIGILNEEGYYSMFADGKWKLTKKSLIVARGIEQNSLYFIQAKLDKGEVNVTEESFTSELWHRQLGHMS